jgi:hypothetical protein
VVENFEEKNMKKYIACVGFDPVFYDNCKILEVEKL